MNVYKSDIHKGDTVKITAQGTVRTGLVHSVSRDWKDGDYSIELMSDTHGAVYWKQGSDGGTVEIIKKGE
jgi:hypothetical protein